MRLLSPDGPDLPGGAVSLGAVTQRLAAEPEHGGSGNGIKINVAVTSRNMFLYSVSLHMAQDHITYPPVPGVERIVGVSAAPAPRYLHIVLPA